jgi:nicotinate dehydrogenase subunit A
MRKIVLHVNGHDHPIDLDDEAMPLLYALRGDLGLRGPKFGCGLGQCGACSVLVDGAPVRSCLIAAADVGTGKITTLEGLGSPEAPHPVQAAFIAEQAGQCGYCSNGMIIAATALLASNPHPTRAEVRDALGGNLCRCGSHMRVIAAVLRAAGRA